MKEPLKIFTGFTCERKNFIVLQFQGLFEDSYLKESLLCNTPFESILEIVKKEVEQYSFKKDILLLKLDENTCIIFENKSCGDAIEYIDYTIFKELKKQGFKFKRLTNMVHVLRLPTIDERESRDWTRFEIKTNCNYEVYALQDKVFKILNDYILI